MTIFCINGLVPLSILYKLFAKKKKITGRHLPNGNRVIENQSQLVTAKFGVAKKIKGHLSRTSIKNDLSRDL